MSHARMIAVALLVAAIGGCSSSTAPSGGGGGGGGGACSGIDSNIGVCDNFFSPTPVTVAINTTVKWTFKGRVTHNVTFPGFSSGTLLTGTYTHQFTAPGTFDYQCTIHPGMNGQIIVTP